MNAKRYVSLRYKGIDTLETHFNPGDHQPLDLADAAADFNLAQAGITVTRWSRNRRRVLEADDNKPDYILSRQLRTGLYLLS